MNDHKHATIVFLVGYGVLLLLMGVMLWPFISAVVFAAILAGVFSKPMEWVSQVTGHRKLSAILLCLLIVLALFLPSLFIIFRLVNEAMDLYQYLRAQLTNETLEKILASYKYLHNLLKEIFQIVHIEFSVESIKNLLLSASASISTALLTTLNAWIANFMAFLFHFLIMLVVIYALLAEGPRLKRFFLALSPLPDDENELVIKRFKQINYVTLAGNGIGGLVQGLLAGIGLWVAGIESIALWTTLMVFLAFLPLVGITFVYVPICLYLFFIDRIVAGIVLFIYCTLIAQVVENWYKPRFVGNRVEISATLVLLSIIGGLSAFGIMGIFFGPLIISIFLTFVDLYRRRYGNAYPDVSSAPGVSRVECRPEKQASPVE